MPKLLLLGGSGFLGRHVQNWAKGKWETTAPSSQELDLLDPFAVKGYFLEHSFDAVIHAAGFVGGIGLNLAHPGRMVSDNLRMGLNLLEALKSSKGIHVVIVSTVCAYPVDAPIPTPETSLLDGIPAKDTLPYGLAKRTLYVAAEALSREFGMRFTYVVPTNLYGPGDHFEESKSNVVPALIKRAHGAKVAGDKELVVWGDGTQTRDLLYVEDAAQALLKIAQGSPTSGVFNLSSDRETSVRQLAEAVCFAVGFEGGLVFDKSKPGGAPRRALDGSKVREVFGVEPTTDLRKGIASTYQWFLANRGPAMAGTVNE